ncbi:MAG: UDP-galactopyranose mutase, partial [Sphingomicrobium sp.]
MFQRPQHLMTRFARDMNVVVWEEPIVVGADETAFVNVRRADGFPTLRVVVPHLPEGLSPSQAEAALTQLFDSYAGTISGPVIAWYYTPMMLPFSRGLAAD